MALNALSRLLVILGAACAVSSGTNAVAASPQPGVWVSVDGAESVFFGREMVFDGLSGRATVQFAQDGRHGVSVTAANRGHVDVTLFDGPDVVDDHDVPMFQGGTIARNGKWRATVGENMLYATFDVPPVGECSGRRAAAPRRTPDQLPWVVSEIEVVICR